MSDGGSQTLQNCLNSAGTMMRRVLQEYLIMEFEFYYPEDAWKTKFENWVKEGTEGYYRKSYIGVWEEIQEVGIENYSVFHMDTAIMTSMLLSEEFQNCRDSSFFHCLKEFRKLRNGVAHVVTESLSDLKICLLIFQITKCLREFTSIVSKRPETKRQIVPKNRREDFQLKFRDELNKLDADAEAALVESIRVDNSLSDGDIQKINDVANVNMRLELLRRGVQKDDQNRVREVIDFALKQIPEQQQDPPQTVNLAASIKNVRLATYDDLIALGYDPLSIAKRLVENDYSLYPEQVVATEGTPEQWAKYLSSYPETFRYLINDENAIIGNWSFLAVSEDIHREKLLSGELTEETFSIAETEFVSFSGDYIGYLLNMSVNEGYKDSAYRNLLVNSLVEQLIAMAEQRIFFKTWYVNVFREDHEAMYRRLGFHFLVNNNVYGKVYELHCAPFPEKSLLGENKRLKELYDEHFA